MKKLRNRFRLSRLRSFTLIELLVVIAIIAILAGVILGPIANAIKIAQRAKAFNTACTIQSSCMAYYTEYSLYPVPNGTTVDYMMADDATAYTPWQNLICALSGNIHPSDGTAFATTPSGPTNARGIPFLSMKSSDVFPSTSANKDAPKNPLPTSATADIFFFIAFDSDYSGIMGNAQGTPTSAITGGSATTGLPNFTKSTTTTMDWTGTSTAGVAVWANCNGSTAINPGAWVHTY